MSHHKRIIIDGIDYGHLRIKNSGEVISIVIRQPWDIELFIPEIGLREKYEGEEE